MHASRLPQWFLFAVVGVSWMLEVTEVVVARYVEPNLKADPSLIGTVSFGEPMSSENMISREFWWPDRSWIDASDETMEVLSLMSARSQITFRSAEIALRNRPPSDWPLANLPGRGNRLWMKSGELPTSHFGKPTERWKANWWIADDLAPKVENLSAIPNTVLFGFGLMPFTILAFGTRKIRRLVRSINRRSRPRSIYRYYY